MSDDDIIEVIPDGLLPTGARLADGSCDPFAASEGPPPGEVPTHGQLVLRVAALKARLRVQAEGHALRLRRIDCLLDHAHQDYVLSGDLGDLLRALVQARLVCREGPGHAQ